MDFPPTRGNENGGQVMSEEKRQYGTGSVIKLPGSRFWYILYRVNGRQIRESSKTESKMEAEKLLQKRMGETGLGIRPEQDVKGVKYENIRDAWLASNKNGYGAIKHLDQFFGGRRVISIDTDLLRVYIDHRRKGGAADETTKRSLNDLRAMMNQARKEGKLRAADVPNFPMAALRPGKIRKGFVEPAAFEKVKNALPEALRPLVTFLFVTGCRVGAARQITWEMVSKDCSEISLPGAITKSGEPLVLPMTGEGLRDVAAILRKKFRTDGPVFDTTNLRVEWNKACVAAGVGTMAGRHRTGLTLHDLRRSAVRNLIRAGVSRTVAMAISGHKTEHVFERYNITDTSDVAAALERVGKYAARKV
jgi:integrase